MALSLSPKAQGKYPELLTPILNHQTRHEQFRVLRGLVGPH